MPPPRSQPPMAPGPPAATASLIPDLFLTAGPNATVSATHRLPPAGEVYLQLHSVLIIIIFSVVCLLLLVAFFYAFCFRCSIQSSPKPPGQAPRRGPSLDAEDATYRRSSSDGPSVGNVV